jgi:hypothetical protein
MAVFPSLGAVKVIYGTFYAHKHAEAALQKSEEKFRNLFDDAQIADRFGKRAITGLSKLMKLTAEMWATVMRVGEHDLLNSRIQKMYEQISNKSSSW